jgi:hypothetical protein
MLLHGIHLIGSLLVLTSAGAAVQVPVPEQLVPAAAEAAASQALVPAQSGTRVAPVTLQTAEPPEQYSMPAGVCPVITDYLYQQCQQNPADAMCAPPVSATD